MPWPPDKSEPIGDENQTGSVKPFRDDRSPGLWQSEKDTPCSGSPLVVSAYCSVCRGIIWRLASLILGWDSGGWYQPAPNDQPQKSQRSRDRKRRTPAPLSINPENEPRGHGARRPRNRCRKMRGRVRALRFGNHSETAFVAGRQLPDSPAPTEPEASKAVEAPASDVRIETTGVENYGNGQAAPRSDTGLGTVQTQFVPASKLRESRSRYSRINVRPMIFKFQRRGQQGRESGGRLVMTVDATKRISSTNPRAIRIFR